MSEIITEISIYLILAILLGYTFGWLITKARLKEKIEHHNNNIQSKEFDRLKQEELEEKEKNSELVSQNNKILLENREQKLKIHHLLKKLQERDLLIKSKNSDIEELKMKLLKQKESYEIEMLAFIKEREEILSKMQPSKN